MKIIFTLGLILASMLTSCQIQWKRTSNWNLYRYQGHGLFKYPIDSLKYLDKLSMNQDSIQSYMASAQVLHPEGPVAWMGGYIATCTMDGELRKIELSNYGGFFYDEKTKTYYQVQSDLTELWVSYLQDCYLILTHKTQ
jgi:hypothetical protein